jgi:Leucine-rich repeat (LRR) protein
MHITARYIYIYIYIRADTHIHPQTKTHHTLCLFLPGYTHTSPNQTHHTHSLSLSPRVKPTDAKQRSWYVFEHALVLPEYVVEFDYVLKPPVSPDPPVSFMTDLMDRGILQPQNETEANDMGPLARNLVKFLYKCSQATGKDKEVEDDVCNTPPVLPQRAAFASMTLDTIVGESGNANIASITYLNLHANSIRKIENLSGLFNLQTLILSFNEIAKMEGFDQLPNLTKLDMSFNLVRRLENLRNLSTLTTLEMSSNMVHRAEDLSALRKYVGNLTTLDLSNNPVCDMKSYRHYVLRRLLKIRHLDGVPVTEEELSVALANTSSIKSQLIKDNAFVQRRSNWSLMPARFRRQTAIDRDALQLHDADDESWWTRVQDLELNHRHLRKLSNLDRLVNMKVLSVCDNEILQIQGLELCENLEELLMEENRISRIEGLERLYRLKKLDLGKNRISRIENLQALTHLAQLSLEDNEVMCALFA